MQNAFIVCLTKTLRVMRLSAIIILATALHVSAKTVSQTTVTYSGKNVEVKQIFSVIEKQTGFVVFYNNDLLKHTRVITIDAVKLPLEDFLKTVLKDQQL